MRERRETLSLIFASSIETSASREMLVWLVSVFLRDVEFSQMVIYRQLDGLKRQMSKPVLMVRIH